jgi:hypothetical protein
MAVGMVKGWPLTTVAVPGWLPSSGRLAAASRDTCGAITAVCIQLMVWHVLKTLSATVQLYLSSMCCSYARISSRRDCNPKIV